jgi:hypothetical protein
VGCLARRRAKHDELIRGATKFIIDRQCDDGGWPNSYDEWFAINSPRRPNRCLNYSGWWAPLALMHSVAHDHDARRACRLAIKRLIDTQSPDGAWRFEEYEDTRHVWLTAQIVVVLHQWQRLWPEHDSRSTARDLGDLLAHAVAVARRNTVAIILGVLLAKQMLPGTLRLLADFQRTAGIDHASIDNNLLSSAIWALLAAGAAALVSLMRRRR